MDQVWLIPKVPNQNGREDWLEAWLELAPMDMCCRILMIAWRVWYARNEITHDKPLPSIEGSKRFICSYMQSLENIRKLDSEVVIKGKLPVGIMTPLTPVTRPTVTTERWTVPPLGRLKLNVDGAYVAQTGDAGVGIILRNNEAVACLAACQSLNFCSSALDAELQACLMGVRLALDHSNEEVPVETDSLELVRMALGKLKDGSSLGPAVEDLKLLLAEERIISL
jgi:hypothetical protein